MSSKSRPKPDPAGQDRPGAPATREEARRAAFAAARARAEDTRWLAGPQRTDGAELVAEDRRR